MSDQKSVSTTNRDLSAQVQVLPCCFGGCPKSWGDYHPGPSGWYVNASTDSFYWPDLPMISVDGESDSVLSGAKIDACRKFLDALRAYDRLPLNEKQCAALDKAIAAMVYYLKEN